MLFKVQDGFYLNSQHIIAVRIKKSAYDAHFEIEIEYTPNTLDKMGLFIKRVSTQVEAELFLAELHRSVQ